MSVRLNELSHALKATLFLHGDSWEPRVILILVEPLPSKMNKDESKQSH